MARPRDAASQSDRVVATELRHISIGVTRKGRTVPFVAETPRNARERMFEFWPSGFGRSVGEIGDRIEAADRQTGAPIRDHPLGGSSASSRRDRDHRKSNES